MTPLDVVKTRLQSANLGGGGGASFSPAALRYGSPADVSPRQCGTCREGSSGHEPPQSRLRSTCTPTRRSLHVAPVRSTAVGMMLQLVRREGLSVLWSGLLPSLIMAVPSTAIYFAVYDELKITLQHGRPPDSGIAVLAPLIAGISGRSLTVAMVAPLELVRTKAMYRRGVLSGGLLRALRDEVAAGGLSSLWRGLMPTLWRDVPFSGIYWLGYERVKAALNSAFPPDAPHSLGRTFAIAFAAGVSSGSVAAVVTTPFDVVKTRRQVLRPGPPSSQPPSIAVGSSSGGGLKPPPLFTSLHRDGGPHVAAGAVAPSASTLTLLRAIWRNEGWAGVFAGWPARLARVAPSCAIMISTYEGGKLLFLTAAGVEEGEAGGTPLTYVLEE